MEPLTLAIPTGRLFAETVSLLQSLGILREAPPERSLVFPAADNLRMLIAKPVDLLTYIEQGAADAGIVGKDLLLEQGRDVYELVDLEFGACRGVVALPEGQQERLWQPGGLLRIATKYPRISAAFFEEHHRSVELIELHGSVEVAPRVGLADGIVDLVMTGRTLRDNLLVEVAEIFRSTARLAVNRASLRMKSVPMQRLIERLERASQARVGGRPTGLGVT